VSIDKVIKPGQIFVFGSNLKGYHGAGAAAEAVEKYGAVMGIGEGLQGHAYALPTKDERLVTLPLYKIEEHVHRFLVYAASFPKMQFFVTRVGCGLAGLTDEQMGPLFKGAPSNVELPHGWGT
jgi:hypothetical protein